MSNFTPDEQYTMLTLWAMFRSPLMIGCNLPEIDDFTLNLITNKEVLDINQYSKGNKELFDTKWNNRLVCSKRRRIDPLYRHI